MDATRAAAQRDRLLRLCLTLVGVLLLFWHMSHPVVRFVSPPLNFVVAGLLALLLPWVALVQTFRLGPGWAKATALCAAVPLLIYSALVVLVFSGYVADAARLGHMGTFQPVASVEWNGSAVRLYRNDGGRRVGFGMAVRQEKPIGAGLLLVRELDFLHPCSALSLTLSPGGVAVRGELATCPGLPGQSREYQLKPGVF